MKKAFIIFICGLLLFCNSCSSNLSLREENILLKKELSSAERRIEYLEMETDDFGITINDLENTVYFYQRKVETFYEEYLTPDENKLYDKLITDLLQHPELIPYEGVLGGTPHFTEFRFIDPACTDNKGFLYANTEDGHIVVDVIYYYKIFDDDSIDWDIIAYLYAGTEEGYKMIE